MEALRGPQDVAGDNDALSEEHIRTDPGKMMGTARYMSPEQIRGQEVDGRSDIFSLGVVLYELVAGFPPFGGATPGEVMAAILTRDAPNLIRYSREAPAELERIVSKALAKERESRYQVIEDFLNDLKNLKLELELEAKLKRSGQSDDEETAIPPDRLAEQKGQRSETESLYSTQLSPASQSSVSRTAAPSPWLRSFTSCGPQTPSFRPQLRGATVLCWSRELAR